MRKGPMKPVPPVRKTWSMMGVSGRHAGTGASKMRAVSAHGATVDSLRVAVLAALNIADEMLALRTRCEVLTATIEASRQREAQSMVRSRAGSLMGMLDAVLEERKAG